MPSAPRTLILGDLHLVRETPPAVGDDLAGLLAAHPGARVVVAGDLFDLPACSPPMPPRAAVAAALGAHPEAGVALGRHLDTGGELWLLGGNHDAEVAAPGFAEALADMIGASPAARPLLRTSPWFFREGGLHVEHGHVYDPDNAPAHPLVDGARSLGVLFVEEFIAPAGAHRYLQINDRPPLELFLRSFTWYGPRAPYVIYRYFHAALTALLRSGPFYRAAAEPALGQGLVDAFAVELGVDRELVLGLLPLGATPTLESLARTFSRIYMDRVIATLAIAGGLGAAALGHAASGGGAALLGALLMTLSWSHGKNRYGTTVAEHLAEGARRVGERTGASVVVFGHTHREAEGAGYANTGSFAFPRGAAGRPFLEIEGAPDRPRAVRRHWSRRPLP